MDTEPVVLDHRGQQPSEPHPACCLDCGQPITDVDLDRQVVLCEAGCERSWISYGLARQEWELREIILWWYRAIEPKPA